MADAQAEGGELSAKYDRLQKQETGKTDQATSENAQKVIDLEKANKEKEEQIKELEKVLAEQKTAYEILLDTLKEKETSE